MDHLLDNLRESFPSRFLKYENELNKICIEEFGQEWDAKKQKLKGNRKTYTDKDGKRHLVDNVDVRHTCKGIFLKNWFEKTSANESFYYVLNEWIELEWGWSHEFDCFVLLEFIKFNDKYSFEDVINLVRCHKNFNETESEKKERLQSIKKEIDNKYKNIKEVQSSLGYFVRKYLNLKTQFIFDYFPKLEKKISKEAIFRKLDDERADYEKKQLDAKEYYLQDDTYNEPSDPVWRFKEVQKMFSKCDMDWFRSSVIEAIKKISKEHKLEALENYDLWLLYSSMCFKNLNKNDWQDNIKFWIDDFTYERKKKKHLEFYKFTAGLHEVEKLFHGENSEDSYFAPYTLEGQTHFFIFLCRLYELISMNNASKQYWNESLSLHDIKDSMRPAYFAQQFINKETFHGDIFKTNYRFYRALDMLEAYEDSESKDWDDYMKKNYFFFDNNYSDKDGV